jgi:hypothetical protein
VQARDRDQVRDARAVRRRSTAPGEWRADRRSRAHDDAGVQRTRQRGQDALADPLAQALHVSSKLPAKASIRCAACGATTEPVARSPCSSSHASRSKPAGLDVPMRTLEPHGQLPALPRVHHRHFGVGVVAARRGRIPCERDARRHDRAIGDRLLDAQCEARSPLALLRQVVHHGPRTTMSRLSHCGGSASARRTFARSAA